MITNINRLKNKVPTSSKIVNVRLLGIIALVLILFNVLSVYVLPNDIFLVSAAEIDVYELVNLTNAERANSRLNTLTVDSRLVTAAQAKAEDMIAKDYWSHYGPDGESPWQFILASGYEYIYAGENLAKDFASAAPIHNAWMASPSHRENLLNPNFSNIGIAAVTGEFQGKETTIVVQMFGTAYGISDATHSDDNATIDFEIPDNGTMQSPTIINPKDGDILRDGAFDVRGSAVEGSFIDIYDQDKFIGTTELEGISFTYTPQEPFSEGAHTLYAQARDSANTSEISNFVEVVVDTITPAVDIQSAQLEYVKADENKTSYGVSFMVYDNPSEVIGVYKDEEVIFVQAAERWEGQFEESDGSFGDLYVTVQDKAGNISETMLSGIAIENLLEESEAEVAGVSIGIQDWVVENVLARILTRSLRGQINFIISLVMFVLVAAEGIVLSKTGLTKVSVNPLLHLPVFAILIFVSLIGSGGEIL